LALLLSVAPCAAAGSPTWPLARSLQPASPSQTIVGYQALLQADPDNVALHDGLASLYEQAGDFASAAAQFSESLRLKPSVAGAHYNLGHALFVLRRYDEAERRFREAIALAPQHAEAHLGVALVDMARGHSGAAVDALREALMLRADWPEAELALAWVLSTSSNRSVRRPDEAVALAEAALGPPDRQNSRALDVLAAALAAVGQFERAEATARRAMEQADSEGDSDTSRVLRARIGLYAQHQAFIDPDSER